MKAPENPGIEKIKQFRTSHFLITCILLMILGSCKKDMDTQGPKFSPELLTSTIWGDDTICGYSRTAEVYTRIFAKGGAHSEFSNGYQSSFRGTWSLKDDETLVINNDEFTILELNGNKLRIKSKSWQSLFCVSGFTALTSTKASTLGVSALSKTSARLHGYVRTCSLTDVSFEYWVKTSEVNTAIPANNSFEGPAHKKLEVTLTGLLPETVYHYRIKAVDPSGTSHGQELTFRTYNSMTVSDADSNVYPTLTIGSQIWMAENLRTTKYNDGTKIPEVRDNLNWTGLNTPGHCWYENDSLTYRKSYGALYNWHTVNTGKLCPVGWRVPDRQDWTTLLQYLGENAGDKLTEGSFDHLAFPIGYTEASNESGFSAKETGVRALEEYFFRLSVYTLWSCDEENTQNAWRIFISPGYAGLNVTDKKNGLPVRCLKD
jgi:uncharacterized protein (TIGR02145 family)